MSLALTSVNVPREPGEILTPLDVVELAELNAPLMKTVLVNWLVKTQFVSTPAVACHVETMPFVFLKGMQLGAGARVGSKKTSLLASVSVNVKT